MPNDELADSTGPFALAYAHMFNPTVGSIIMALAVVACLGSLLGWQFTIAQTGKSAADERMFPAFFSKVNNMGAPMTGMIVLGVVQTLLALSTISPTLSEQFSALVNLAVVTNVIPYVVALSALMVMMKSAKAPEKVYSRNVVIVVVAMVYSVFALYASGAEAVLGGMLVLGRRLHHLGLHRAALHRAVDGCGCERHAPVPVRLRRHAAHARAGYSQRQRPGPRTCLTPARDPPGEQPCNANYSSSHCVAARSARGARRSNRPHWSRRSAPDCLPRERRSIASSETGHIRLGYIADARPFSFPRADGPRRATRSTLCKQVADKARSRQLALPGLTMDWAPVEPEERLQRS